MDLRTEKSEIIRRFEQVNDISLIKAIKNLLDFGLSKQMTEDEALEAAFDRAIEQVREGKVKPHNEIRKKYEKWL